MAELIPDNSTQTTSEERLAVTNELLDYDVEGSYEDVPEGPTPFGKSWQFDFSTGQFVRFGTTPAETQGIDTLRQWVLLCMQTDQGAHPIFDDEFGIEDLNSIIGEQYSPALMAQYERSLVEALLKHDRIDEVSDFDVVFVPEDSAAYIAFVIRINGEDESLTFKAAVAASPGVY